MVEFISIKDHSRFEFGLSSKSKEVYTCTELDRTVVTLVECGGSFVVENYNVIIILDS